MATTIKLKNGSGAPLAGDLVQGEPALDLTNKRLYTEDSGGTVIEVGTNPSTIDINAGTIDGTVIGGSSAAAGTFTTFTSTGIDDNATSTAITIDASQNVGIGTTSPATFNAAQCNNLVVGTGSGAEGITVYSGTTSQGGLAFADGTSASDQYRGLIQYDHNSNNMLFWTNTSERMRIDSSGNVGIGTASPVESSGYNSLTINDTTSGYLALQSAGSTKMEAYVSGGTEATLRGTGVPLALTTTAAHDITFDTNAAERMRIDSSGRLLVGKTSSSITTAGSEVTSASILQSASSTSTNLATNSGAVINLCNTSATDGNFSNIGGYNSNGLVVSQMNFINLNHASRTGAITLSTHDGTSLNEAMRIDSSGRVGIGTPSPNATLTVDGQGAFGSAGASGNGIYLYVSGALSDNSYMSRGSSGTGTTTWYIGNQSITTSSDVRLKDNIVDSERNAVEIINNLRVVDHTWNDPSDQSVNNKNSRGVWTGLIAQEAVEHIPWLVNRPLEDVDENGYENYWHMDYGYAVPLLIKAIQEQQAMIEILQAEVAALKGA
jgi:hypothetical protein